MFLRCTSIRCRLPESANSSTDVRSVDHSSVMTDKEVHSYGVVSHFRFTLFLHVWVLLFFVASRAGQTAVFPSERNVQDALLQLESCAWRAAIQALLVRFRLFLLQVFLSFCQVLFPTASSTTILRLD